MCGSGGRALGPVETRAHELVSVLSDCHQRGDADQTEQLIPEVQKEVLQAARANAVLCEDREGEAQCWKLPGRRRPGSRRGDLGAGCSSGETLDC